jgi:hypothetical protein
LPKDSILAASGHIWYRTAFFVDTISSYHPSAPMKAAPIREETAPAVSPLTGHSASVDRTIVVPNGKVAEDWD